MILLLGVKPIQTSLSQGGFSRTQGNSWNPGARMGSPNGSRNKESTCNAGDAGNMGLIPGLRRFSGEGNVNSRSQWQTHLAGASHGQCGLVGCSPWGHAESDTTEHTHATTEGKNMTVLIQPGTRNRLRLSISGFPELLIFSSN